jgi:sucrose phosphorylase
VRGILDDAEVEGLVRRALEHGGFISYKDMPDGTRLPYELNINYLDALSHPAAKEPVELSARKLLTAQAIMLSLRGVPGIYFHSLFGSRGDRAGAETSNVPRRINRQKLDGASLEAELSDAGSLRARVFGGHREILGIRQQHPAFAPTAGQHVLGLDARVFALLRQGPEPAEAFLCLHNVSPEAVPVQLEASLPRVQRWEPLWGSEHSRAASRAAVLEPWGSLWLAAVLNRENRCARGVVE